MKNIFTLLVCLATSIAGFSQTYYSWDFSTYTLGNFPTAGGFVTWKLDAGVKSTSLSTQWATYTTGWIVANEGQPYAGTESAFTSTGIQADRWLCTPNMSIPTGVPNVALVWNGFSLSAGNLESYQVRISTTDSNSTSFDTIAMSVTEPANLTVHILPLAAYAGRHIRVAFRDTTTNEWILLFTNMSLVNLPSYDMTVQNLLIYEHNYSTTATPITGTLQNLGFNAVTSYTLNYQANGGAVVSTPVTGVNIAPLATATYNSGTPFSPSSAGTYAIKVWCSNINGNADQNPSNDTARASGFYYPQVTGLNKKVLLEEFTGAGCPWCPGGAMTLRDIAAANPNVIEVAVHSADINDLGISPAIDADKMQTPEGEALVQAVGTGFPTAVIDRLYDFDNGSLGVGIPVYVGGQGNSSAWGTTCAFRYTQATPVNVSLANKVYDAGTNTLTVDVNATFLNSLSQGTYNINLYVVEDSVITSGTGYDQDNSIYTSGSGNGFTTALPIYNMPSTIPNNGQPNSWTHNHVLRRMAGSTWGTVGIIPSAPVAGTTYTKSYTVSIDPTWRAQFCHIIGVVQEYNTNVNLRTVLNSVEASLIPLGVNETSLFKNLTVYPNPASTMAKVEMDLKEDAIVYVSVANYLGQTVIAPDANNLNAGIHTVNIPVSNLATGLYFVKITVNGETTSMPLSIVGK